MLAATKRQAAGLQRRFPVFAYIARVDKDVFWHPRNPWRRVLKALAKQGTARIELHLYRIAERTPGRPPRVWPLRVLRIQDDHGYDSGYRVLPASDWDPEY